MAGKVKVVSFPVPQTKNDANALLALIGVRNAKLESIQARRDERIAAANRRASEESAPLMAERDGLVQALAAYCEAHRDELTDGGKVKTAKFMAGEVSWRFTPPAVSLKGVPKIIEAIKARRLAKKFLRVTYTVNKEAMLEEQELARSISGVSIGQREELIFRPNKGGEVVGKTTKLPAS